MKRKALGLLLFLLIVPIFIGCDQASTQATTQKATTVATTTVELALGSVTFEIVTTGDNPDTTEVEETYVSESKTVEYFEGDSLFSLLMDNFAMACQGEDGNSDDTCSYLGAYGHYVVSIGTLVPTESNEFISFNINGEYAMTGIDDTELVDGYVYSFTIGTF